MKKAFAVFTPFDAVQGFVSRINKSVTTLPAPPKGLSAWNGKVDEGTYNLDCATKDGSSRVPEGVIVEEGA